MALFGSTYMWPVVPGSSRVLQYGPSLQNPPLIAHTLHSPNLDTLLLFRRYAVMRCTVCKFTAFGERRNVGARTRAHYAERHLREPLWREWLHVAAYYRMRLWEFLGFAEESEYLRKLRRKQ
jgi:hypothetical protein